MGEALGVKWLVMLARLLVDGELEFKDIFIPIDNPEGFAVALEAFNDVPRHRKWMLDAFEFVKDTWIGELIRKYPDSIENDEKN